MNRKFLYKILEDGRETKENTAKDLYEYWLSVQGKIPLREEPKIPNWGLDIIFSGLDRETGKMKNQGSVVYFHGTIRRLQKPIEENGLRYTEGVACLTRKITHALEHFCLVGNYTMVGNFTVDPEIDKLVEEGIIPEDLSEDKKAQLAFEYWCQDDIRERLGLLTIWRPPAEMIALDKKENKIHKRHFALYSPTGNQTAAKRRKELKNENGKEFYLDPSCLLAELKPNLELRKTVFNLKQLFGHGKDIFKLKNNLEKSVKKAILKLDRSYSLKQLEGDIIDSIAEGYLLGLVHTTVEFLVNGRDCEKRVVKLKKLQLTMRYLDEYRKRTLCSIKGRL